MTEGKLLADLRFFGLKSCDTCRAAKAALEAAGHDLDVTDVRADGVSRADLARFVDTFGDAVVNRRSTTWRGLSAAERARNPVDLLADHPTLMKRPVIEAAGMLHLGWSKEVQAALL